MINCPSAISAARVINTPAVSMMLCMRFICLLLLFADKAIQAQRISYVNNSFVVDSDFILCNGSVMNIKEQLSKKRLGQMDLARALGVTQQMASMIMNGKRKVPIAKMAAFEKFTGIPRKLFRPELFQ
jgi:predicted XRE-type DNA-binding protein